MKSKLIRKSDGKPRRLEIVPQTERDEVTLADLARIFCAGSTTRREFAYLVGSFRDRLDSKRDAQTGEPL